MLDIKLLLERRLMLATDRELMQASLDEINHQTAVIKDLQTRLAVLQSQPVITEPEPIEPEPTADYIWQTPNPKKLTDYDIPRIAHIIEVGEDEIHAVLDVESRGYGFDENGVIRLFEEHVFYRELPEALRQEAIDSGLAYPKWRQNYSDNYERLLQAYELHPEAALMSCSWGLGQIMGFNFRLADYDSVQEMVAHFALGEAPQLEAVVQFIRAANLDDELRAHDWAGFARGYNGKGYRKNRYDTRLKARYEWWQQKPDTPWTPDMAEKESISAAFTNG